MIPKRFMIIAGEASGDALAAELVQALKSSPVYQTEAFPPEFFGAGGPKMAAAGVELALDMMAHSVVGLQEAVRAYFKFKKILNDLVKLAVERTPDVIVCVDFPFFNHSFAHAVSELVRRQGGREGAWQPKIVKYVSPQVWASRPGRAAKMAKDFALLLCTFPFEQVWFAKHVPQFKVEFVGNPIIDRYAGNRALELKPPVKSEAPLVLLLPGSRSAEIRRHLRVMVDVAKRLQEGRTLRFRMILPSQSLASVVVAAVQDLPGLEIQVGGLPESLAEAALAISKTGTVTLECAYFRVPTVTLYKTSWLTYLVGRMIVTVTTLTMPNLLANEMVYPEFIQHAATVENMLPAAIELLENPKKRAEVRAKLDEVVASLGEPGAAKRAAVAILRDC